MKKIFKKGLLTVTSLASVAGSVAAVVSCGEEAPPGSTNQKNYDAALNDLISLLGNTNVLGTINVLEGTTNLDSVKTQIETAINTLITNTDSIKEILGTANVTIPANAIPTNIGSHTSENLELIVSSKTTDGVNIPTTPSNFKVSYTVMHNFVQDDYTNAVDAVITHFRNNNLFIVATGTSDADITASIQANIKSYVDSTTADDKLTDNQKASLDVSSLTAIEVTSSHLNKTKGRYTTVLSGTNNTISVNIPAGHGLAKSSILFTDVRYEFIDPQTQANYTSALNAIITHFTNNALFTASTLEMRNGTNNQTTGAITVIKPLIQQNVLAYINSTGSDKLTSVQRAALKADITATNISVDINGTLGITQGDHNTVASTANITITIPAGVLLSSKPTPLTGVKYIIRSDQQDYDVQSKLVLDNIGTADYKISISQNDSDAQVKGHIVDAINGYISDHSTTLTAIKSITAADIPGATGITTSAPVSDTTHNISLTIPKADGSTATASPITKSLNYSVISPQDTYNNLVNKLSGRIVLPRSQWEGVFVYKDGQLWAPEWSTDEMNNQFHDSFLEAIQDIFKVYYSTLTPSLQRQVVAIFGTGTIVEDFIAPAALPLNFNEVPVKIKFKSTNPAVTPAMSSVVFNFVGS